MTRVQNQLASVIVFLIGCMGCSSSGSVGGAERVPDGTLAGRYNVSLTYGENGCDLDDWVEGTELTSVVLDMEQSSSNEIRGEVEGIVGGILALVHGSNVYEGTVAGSEFTMRIDGQYPQVNGGCASTFDNLATGKVEGDFISGTLEFLVAGDGDPDCEAVECSSKMAFTGSRPPRGD